MNKKHIADVESQTLAASSTPIKPPSDSLMRTTAARQFEKRTWSEDRMKVKDDIWYSKQASIKFDASIRQSAFKKIALPSRLAEGTESFELKKRKKVEDLSPDLSPPQIMLTRRENILTREDSRSIASVSHSVASRARSHASKPPKRPNGSSMDTQEHADDVSSLGDDRFEPWSDDLHDKAQQLKARFNAAIHKAPTFVEVGTHTHNNLSNSYKILILLLRLSHILLSASNRH